VREAAKRLIELGAKVEEVSIPMHLLGPVIWTPIGTEGLTQTMMCTGMD
jgi:amidase